MHGRHRTRRAKDRGPRVAGGETAASRRKILDLEEQQRGLVTRLQLLEHGLSAATVDWRVRTGELAAVHRGVYLVGPLMPPGARELAAVLAIGEGCFVSHRSAAHLHGLLAQPPVDEVSVAGRRLDSRRGIVVHSVAELRSDETLRLDGIPVTTPARTVLDLGSALSTDQLAQLIAEACARFAGARRQLDVLVERYPRRRGSREVRELLERPRGPAFSRSRAERLLLQLLRRAELPPAAANAMAFGYEVDFLWDELKLVAEFDGHAFHAARPKRERDSRRDQELIRPGYVVFRITWGQLTARPEALLARLAMTIGRRQVELARGLAA